MPPIGNYIILMHIKKGVGDSYFVWASVRILHSVEVGAIHTTGHLVSSHPLTVVLATLSCQFDDSICTQEVHLFRKDVVK